MLNFSFVWALANIVVATICWLERHRDVLHGMHSPLVAFCLTFRSFWLSLIVFLSMICLNDVFFVEGYDWCCFEYISECILDI